ncbi:Ig-like domain-containing domain [Treponema sp. R6D11]
MFRLWNKILLLLCVIFISCGFMDLRPIGVEIEPDSSDSLLPDAYSPVILKFDTEMQKDDTEGIMQITSDIGSVKGDKHWENNSLYFVPVQGWTAGIRYTLNIFGTIHSVDGREMRIDRFISFYAINKNSPPILESYSPSGGSSIGTKSVVFEFIFSRSMDKHTVESALSIDGIGNKTFEWLDNDKTLKVVPDKSLSPWTMYRWNLKESAKSIDGVPLPKSYSDYFTTDLDQVLPQVTNVYPVLFADGCWYPTGVNLETGLQSGQGIAVSFNKPMGENVLRSLRFEPSLTGRTEMLSENSIVYIFTKDPEPDTTFTLIVSADTRDSEGLKIGSEYRINFSVDIPYLNVLSITAGNDQQIESFYTMNNILPVYVDQGTGLITLSIYFSLMFGLEEKLNAPQKITLSPFFPRTLPPSALRYIHWISNDRLFLQWEGLKPGDDVSHYYKLTIPGGKGGITSDTGIFMKEDLVLYLEAIK